MPTIKWLVTVSGELDQAARAQLKKSNKSLSTVVRELMAGWLEQPELADTTKIGRPKKVE